jgi:hypothetical protein
MIGWCPGHNFSVVARSLLIGTINLGLPWDFNELHVAKISPFATSALTAGKQPLYCMGRADLCVSGETASISSIQLCARGISDAVIQSSPAAGEHLLNSPKNAAAHQSSSVPREVDDSSIQVTSFATALSLSSLDRLRASRLLLPRSGLERSDFVPWPFATYCVAARSPSLTG